MSAILIDGGSSINANELAAKFLYSDSGVFYVAFDSSINSTIRSWWLDVLAATDAIIEPEFAIVDATDPKRQLTVKQVESLGSNAGLYSYGYLYSDINGKRIYERDDPSNYSISIAESAYTHASRFANSKEAGWKSTAFHELGHALGLEHSHDWSDGDGDNVINTNNTVMSYELVISNDGNPQFKELDQTALVEIHGKETGQKSTPISGSTLVSDLGTHNPDKSWKPPSLSMEFTAGAYISEPSSGLTKTQLLLKREDGYIESEIKVNLGWQFAENLNWYYPEEYQVGFHDFLMDSPWQVSFAANQSTLAVDVWIVGDTVKEADEWIEVTATPATTPYFLSWPTNPIRLTITEQSIETPKPNSSYTLTPSATTINEGATLTTTVATTNVASGTTLYWSIAGTGVTAADFSSGALTGSGVVGTDGKFSFAHTAANDLMTEGDETLQMKLFADSGLTAQVGSTATVTVKDTSLTPVKPAQRVYTEKPEITYKPTGVAALPLLYTTSSNDANLSGLTLNVYYNSSILTPAGANNGVSGQVAADITTTTILPDTNNSDGDPLTDKIVQLLWAIFDNTFPNKTLPTAIATVSFDTSATKKDPVTGQSLSTTVRYTAVEAAPNYDVLTGSTTFKSQQFNLDVDDDGKVTALGDGLMVIRHLFGSAFSGSGLTDKAISPTSPFLGGATYNTMTAEQKTQVASLVAANIQQGIDAGLLDVDKDGKTTALGDGLMVIRNLFGSAFSGTALIDKAISPTSPFLGGLTYATMTADQKLAASGLVTVNIDALKPTLI